MEKERERQAKKGGLRRKLMEGKEMVGEVFASVQAVFLHSTLSIS